MNYTQNEKIEQVTDSTLVVGVDIGSQLHYARAFDNRGHELTKRVFSFRNDLEGFNSFNAWAEKLKTENNKTAVLIGCEPTGHYWFAFSKYVSEHQKTLVMVRMWRNKIVYNILLVFPGQPGKNFLQPSCTRNEIYGFYSWPCSLA